VRQTFSGSSAGRVAPLAILSALVAVAACSSDSTSPSPGPISFVKNPCSPNTTVSLGVAEAAVADCGNGGTTVTFAGGGANYLIVPQFASNQPGNSLFAYSLATGNVTAAAASAARVASWRASLAQAPQAAAGVLPPPRPLETQRAWDALLRSSARSSSGRLRLKPPGSVSPLQASAAIVVPPVGSTRTFHVRSSWSTTSPTWASVTAQLAYAGDNILLYLDQAAPANGFTPSQLQDFGRLFDQTLDPIDTLNFGSPSDVDQNGRVIMLLSPVVNADTPASTCVSSGYIAGFFDEVDFDGASDPNSNQGEIFYSIVPDPGGTVSCAHSTAQVGEAVPAVFLHELQHLINFSQHVILRSGAPQPGWLDEGLSIVAEEMGSQYYEAKCPPPSCRTDPAQLFPDSAQGFVQGFLYGSYQYALLPDTASLTLHEDNETGFSWRGGDWALLRYLGDQHGSGFYRLLEQGPSDGIADLQAAAGEPLPAFFARFGLALYTDSLPGLPRTTAPAADRFVSRNLRQLWARLYQTSGGTSDIPFVFPIRVFPVTNDTASALLVPGTMTYFRLDTPAADSTVTIRFAAPDGSALSAVLQPQLAIFRLPPGQ
jgi:hypothetical protein